MKKFLLSLCLLAALVGLLALPAHAAAGDVIVPSFDVEAENVTVVQENLPEGLEWTSSRYMGVVLDAPRPHGNEWPAAVVSREDWGLKTYRVGYLGAYGTLVADPAIRSEVFWSFPVVDFGFVDGGRYRLEVGDFICGTGLGHTMGVPTDWYPPFSSGVANFWVEMFARVRDGGGVVVDEKVWLFKSGVTDENLSVLHNAVNRVTFYRLTPDMTDDYFYDFELPAGSLGYVVEYGAVMYNEYTGGDGAYNWRRLSGGTPPMFTFRDVRVVALSSPEEEFQDEQRGFWQRVLDFLQSIVDAIKAIPEAIANFFRQVWDVLRMIANWILTLVRLLVKAVEYFGLILGFLPWWLYAGAVALVAVSVIYKILGREAAG